MSGIPHVSVNDFQTEVLEAGEPVLVDFYADWCQPCLRQAPVLEQYLQDNPGSRIVKVNVDRDGALAQQYDVNSIPTLIVFHGGRQVARHEGFANKEYLGQLFAKG